MSPLESANLPTPPARRGGVALDNPAKRSGNTSSSASPTLDEALISDLKNVGTKLPVELWQLVGERARQLGEPVRWILTDALARALDAQVAEHSAQVRETRLRETRARLQATEDELDQ